MFGAVLTRPPGKRFIKGHEWDLFINHPQYDPMVHGDLPF